MSDESQEQPEEVTQGTAHKEESDSAQEPAADTPAEEPKAEASAEDKLAQMEKDHLYLRAELENIKRQNFKERSQLLKYGAERLARDLLDTVDILKSALQGEVTSENFKDFVNGVEMTVQSLKSTLEKHGITEVDCVGKAFDPNTQEALSSETTDKMPEGFVTQVFKAPFMYHEKLLRPGQVIVSRAKSE